MLMGCSETMLIAIDSTCAQPMKSEDLLRTFIWQLGSTRQTRPRSQHTRMRWFITGTFGVTVQRR